MQAGGVLGRLAQVIAQWLRSLARRLDHAAGGAAVPPAALAALAERFPGAPEHWLADIARQMIEAGEPLPGVDYAAPPMEAPPAREHRSTAPVSASPPPSPRRTRPALRLIGSDPRRRPAADTTRTVPQHRRPASETASPTTQRHPATLRWLAASPKAQAQRVYPELPASSRPLTEFAIGPHNPEPAPPAPTLAFRDAERLTHLPLTATHADPEAARFAAAHRLARQSFVAPNEPGPRPQETAFATPIPPSVADLAASADFSAPTRIPVEFAPLRPAQRVSLAFPQARPQRGTSEWTSVPGTCWPALPPNDQTIADAPAHASPLSDLTREQMAGRWSA